MFELNAVYVLKTHRASVRNPSFINKTNAMAFGLNVYERLLCTCFETSLSSPNKLRLRKLSEKALTCPMGCLF